ncbi:MAG: phosphoribosylglycinamide formyltransferase [Minwuia thermotolerans]|nr:MAG: phosphoribosylglycinamide formyltransferase [Minwuia thermotolerans]
MARLKLGVLISGRGSNLQALIDAAADPAFPAEIAVVISNIADVQGLQRAADAGIETCVIDHKAHDGRAAFESALTEALEARQVRLVCLAGFMRLLTKGFVDHWRDRIINIHPSLLPAFKGLNTHERVLDYGVKFTGCTVHFVRAEMDDGPIIVQGVVPVISSDTPDGLAARVLQVEHRIYPLAVRLVAEGRARVVGNAVNIDVKDHEAEGIILVNPQA